MDRPSVAAGLLISALIYGTVRLNQTVKAEPGPTFALVQANFSPEVKHNPVNGISVTESTIT